MLRWKMKSYQTEKIFTIGKSKLIRIVNFANCKTRIKWNMITLICKTCVSIHYKYICLNQPFLSNVKCILIKKKKKTTNIKDIVIGYNITDSE